MREAFSVVRTTPAFYSAGPFRPTEPMNPPRAPRSFIAIILGLLTLLPAQLLAQDEPGPKTIDQRIDAILGPIADLAEAVIFVEVPISAEQKIPIVLVLLGGTAVLLTLVFGFINFRAFGLAIKTVRGQLTDPKAPGQITHFEALSAALSATVGLGNIAGVAVAIGLGGPGATFWMILMGLCGMTTKFCECTLGVKYRRVDPDGLIRGGAMYYLRDGFAERGLKPIGLILAVLFAIFCIFGTLGAGNMFQANQAHAQFSETFGILENGWIFGGIMAVLAGTVIVGGIVWIARVTSFLVPFMCVIYIVTALTIILGNLGELPNAVSIILQGAFTPEGVTGGFVGVLIQGIKRAAFSNEAGFGSAPIAHSAVRTDKPASEGLVALLEPFTDTVVVCTMTALVIIITGVWRVNGDVAVENADLLSAPTPAATVTAQAPAGTMFDITGREPGPDGKDDGFFQVETLDGSLQGWIPADALTLREGWDGGIWVTSKAFESVYGWFPYLLSLAVFLFAFSTMISWSYYGEQAVIYLFGRHQPVILGYKVVFCLFAIIGAGASLSSVLRISDAAVFAMVIPNLIGVYLLLPVVRKELNLFLEHARSHQR